MLVRTLSVLPPTRWLWFHDLIIISKCRARLHISNFPSLNVLVRNPAGTAARSLYLANDLVKAVITHNSFERLRLTAAGTKVFAKQEGGSARAAATAAATEAEADGIETGTAGRGRRSSAYSARDSPSCCRTLTRASSSRATWLRCAPSSRRTTRCARRSQSRFVAKSKCEVRFRRVLLPHACADDDNYKASGSHIVRFPLGNLDGAR